MIASRQKISAGRSPFIDIIIPTRNRYELTAEAIRSVQSQTFEDWRLLVVDDASTDDSLRRLRQLADGDPRIEIFGRPEEGGAQKARQMAFEESAAPFVALLDSDDLWAPTKLQRQLEHFRTEKERHRDLGAVLCRHLWVDDRLRTVDSPSLMEKLRRDTTRLGKPRPAGSASPFISDNMSVLLIRREPLERAGGFQPAGQRPIRTCDNTEFYLRLTQQGAFIFLEEALVTCRIHSGPRASDTLESIQAAEEMAYLLELHKDILQRWPVERAQLRARTATRYLAAGRRVQGFRYLAAALRGGGNRSKAIILRRFGPFALKSLLRRQRAG